MSYTPAEYREAQGAGLNLHGYAAARDCNATHEQAMEAGKAGLDLFAYARARHHNVTHEQTMSVCLLADDGIYKLCRAGNIYFAGCRGPFTLDEALKHWNREDDRACLFTIALGLEQK